MGDERNDEVNIGERERRAIPLSSIWAQVTSDFGGIFAPLPETTVSTSPSDVSTNAQTTPTRTETANTEMTPASETAPISTVTVEETSLRTTLVTVRFTDISPSYAPASSTQKEATSCTAAASSTLLSSRGVDSAPTNQPVPVPSAVSSGTPFGSTHSPSAGTEPQDNSTASSATAGANSEPTSQKHAIIGGLSGSIAGLVLLGVLACLLWRRRKPRFADDDDSASEKGLRPMFARKWSGLTTRSRAPQPPPPVVSRRSTPEPDPDNQIIRVSLDNWARPYAHDEGYRESQGPTTLRVMNPDLSRPTTPRRPSLETAGSFLKRQRNALAAALYGRPSSRGDSPQRNLQVPASNIDPALSTEFLAPKATTPSIRSGSTNTSTAIIVSQAPEDPFLTPPDETDERLMEPTTTKPPTALRPGITPLQGATGGMTRTLSHLGSAMNPFRTRSNASSTTRSASRHSTSTFSSAGDPFHLQPNIGTRPAQDLLQRGRSGPVVMYEGT